MIIIKNKKRCYICQRLLGKRNKSKYCSKHRYFNPEYKRNLIQSISRQQKAQKELRRRHLKEYQKILKELREEGKV